MDINVRYYFTVRRAKRIAEIGSVLLVNEETSSGLDHILGTTFFLHIHATNFLFLYTNTIFNHFVVIFQPSLYMVAKPTVEKMCVESCHLTPTAKDGQNKAK